MLVVFSGSPWSKVSAHISVEVSQCIFGLSEVSEVYICVSVHALIDLY